MKTQVPGTVLLGCRMCGETRFVRVTVDRQQMADDGQIKVDVSVDDRDMPMLEAFWRTHLKPWAAACSRV